MEWEALDLIIYIYIYIYIAGAGLDWDALDVDSAFHEPEFGYSELDLADYQEGGEGQKGRGTLLTSPQLVVAYSKCTGH